MLPVEMNLLNAVDAAIVVVGSDGAVYANPAAERLVDGCDFDAIISDADVALKAGISVTLNTVESDGGEQKVYTLKRSRSPVDRLRSETGISPAMRTILNAVHADLTALIRCENGFSLLGYASSSARISSVSVCHERLLEAVAQKISTPRDIVVFDSQTPDDERIRCGMASLGFASGCFFPIFVAGGRLFAILMCANRKQREWTDGELRYTDAMCRYIKNLLRDRIKSVVGWRDWLHERADMSALIDNENIILVTLNSDLVITGADGKGLARMGKLPIQLIGHSLLEMGDAAELTRATERALRSYTSSFVVSMVGRWYEVYCSTIMGDHFNQIGIFAILIDITENVRMREEVTRANSSLDIAAFSMRAGFWTFDLETDEIVGDDSCRFLWGVRAGDLPSSRATANTLFCADDVNRLDELIDEAVRNPMRTYFKFRFSPIEVDGSMRYIETKAKVHWENGSPVRIVGIATDITESIEMEERLAREEMRNEVIKNISLACAYNEDIPSAVVYTVAETGRMSGCDTAALFIADPDGDCWCSEVLWSDDRSLSQNGSVCTIPYSQLQPVIDSLLGDGFATTEALGDVSGIVSPDDRSAALFLVARDNDQTSFLWLGNSGQHREWLDEERSFVSTTAGVLRMALRRRRMESELKTALSDAEASNRARSEFFSSISHEIRTPINGVIGMTRLALESCDPREISDCLNAVADSSAHLLRLINDILDFSRMDAGKMNLQMVPFSINDLAERLRIMTRPSAVAKELEFSITVDHRIPDRLFGDEQRISQILINLISNAIKFTDEGFVRVAITRVCDGVMMLAVSDSGSGISKDDISRMFNAYERLGNAAEGYGLGLMITKTLAELMGGDISVESELGVGSTFSVRLPYTAAEDDGSVFEGDSAFVFTAPQANILVVDDNAINRRVSVGMLRKYKVNCDCADSGRAAVDMAAASHYDIILMDHMMPGMDGVEASQIIREAHPDDCPIIVALTANVTNEARRMLLESGLDDFLSKPLDRRPLEEVLLSWLPPELIEDAGSDEPSESGETDDADAPRAPRLPELTDELLSLLDSGQALDRFGGDDFYREALVITAQNIPDSVKQLTALFKAEDYPAFRIEAHGVKGAFASIGAEKLRLCAQRMETLAAHREHDELEQALASFSHGALLLMDAVFTWSGAVR